MASFTLNAMRDFARAAWPVSSRVMASVDATVARAERLASTTFRYGVDQAVKLARKAPSTVLSQIQPINISDWDMPTVRDALEQHELGFFLQSTALADAMGRDDRITGCLNTRVRALASKSGVGFSVTPSTRGDKQAAEDLAKEVTELWWYSCPESSMARILADAVMLGVSFARIHWERFDGRVIPRLEPWVAQTVYYDWSIRRYRAIGIEGQVIIDPGSAEWLIFEPANFRSWLNGAIRGLGYLWLFRSWSRRDWARYCEKHGNPILAIVEPQGNQWAPQKDAFYKLVKNVGRQAVLRLPQDASKYGFDVKVVEPTDRSWQSFKEFLIRLDTDIAVMLLGQNLTTEVQGGSFAAAKSHNTIRLDYLDADAEMLSTTLREYVWKPYVRFNHGREDEEATPWATWQTRPPEDKKARADVIKTYSDACVNFVQAGVQVDYAQMSEELEIPMQKGTQPQILMPPGGAPPAQPTTKAPVIPPAPPGPSGAKGAGQQSQPKGNGKGRKQQPQQDDESDGKGDDAEDKSADDADDDETDEESATALLHAPKPPAKAFPVRSYLGGRIHVTIDRPAGFVQKGVGPDGVPWSRTFAVDYGYLTDTLGGDGEELDVYCGPNAEAPQAFWFVVLDSNGNSDEYKLFLGFDSSEAALACFQAHIPDKFFGGMFSMPVEAVIGLLGQEPVARLAMLNVTPRVDAAGELLNADEERERVKTQPRLSAAAAVRKTWAANVNMSAPAIRSWSLKQESATLRTAAATTVRLLRTEVGVWDQYDVRTAKNAAKTMRRLLRSPKTTERDKKLRSLGCDPDKAKTPVAWTDRG